MFFAILASPDSWYYQDLSRAARDEHEVVALSHSNLCSKVGFLTDSDQVMTDGLDLAQVDAVLVRTMPPGSLEQVVYRMDALARLESLGVPVINPPKAIETAVDKYLTTAKLQAAGILQPKTIVCQTVDQAMEAFETLGEDVVVKPLFGSEGRGLTRLNDEALALRAFKMLVQLGAVIYLQQFIAHDGYDIRILLIGEKTFAMQRRNDHDWRTNVSRGATTSAFEATPPMLDLAKQAAAAIGAPLVGVDLLPARDGKMYVLEVNAVPGWRALSRTLKVDIADLVLKYLTKTVNLK